MNLEQFTPEERKAIKQGLHRNLDIGLAEWTGLGLRKAIRWRADGKAYSATGLTKHILVLNDCGVHPLPGPRYWKVPDGRTLTEIARSLDEDLTDEA